MTNEFKKLKKKELLEVARSYGIDVKGNETNAVLIEILDKNISTPEPAPESTNEILDTPSKPPVKPKKKNAKTTVRTENGFTITQESSPFGI